MIGGDRPATQRETASESGIEITAEMVEAGTAELHAWEPAYDLAGEEAVARIFRAMIEVALEQP